MRHRVKGRKLSRTAEHRRATLRNLATSLLKHKKIKTTIAKAKELRSFVEPIITKAKNDSLAARRYVADFIKEKNVVKELFTDIAAKVGGRPGGYTRIVRLGQRKGDAAELAIIEFVDYSGVLKPKPAKKARGEKAEPEVEEAKVVSEDVKKEEKPKKKASKVSKKKKEDSEEKETKKKKTTTKKAAPKKTTKKS
jgi:large subunit ribosomal protein L17